MNCCNEYGRCNNGAECAARKAADSFPRITMEDDEPLVTFEMVAGWIRNALAGVGILACIVAVGFWSAR
jgi:hypothetical protein